MKVRPYLAFVASIKDVHRAGRAEAVDRAISRCGLESVSGRVIGHLSKGFRQRVGLAQAIVHRPPVIILDEPTVGLDPKQIIEIRSLIKGFAHEHTVLLSTHILSEVTATCERAIIIHEGRIAHEQKIESLTGKRSLEEVFLEVISKESGSKESTTNAKLSAV